RGAGVVYEHAETALNIRRAARGYRFGCCEGCGREAQVASAAAAKARMSGPKRLRRLGMSDECGLARCKVRTGSLEAKEASLDLDRFIGTLLLRSTDNRTLPSLEHRCTRSYRLPPKD